MYHTADDLSRGMAIAVTDKIAIIWTRQPDWPTDFPRQYQGQFIVNRSRFSDKVFHDVFNRYGVELDEHVKDLCYHVETDGEVTLEVVKDGRGFRASQSVSTFHRRR